MAVHKGDIVRALNRTYGLAPAREAGPLEVVESVDAYNSSVETVEGNYYFNGDYAVVERGEYLMTRVDKDPSEQHSLTSQQQAFLDRAEPGEIRDNVHRAYEWMHEQGLCFNRRLLQALCEKAAEAEDMDYADLFYAWLLVRPLKAVEQGEV